MATKKKPLEFQNDNLDISAQILKNSEGIHDLELEIEDSLGRQLRKRKEMSLLIREEYDISKQIVQSVNKEISFQESRIDRREKWIDMLEKKRKSVSSSIGAITNKLQSPKSAGMSRQEIKDLTEQKVLLQGKSQKIKEIIDKNKLDIFSRREGIKLAKDEIPIQTSIMSSLKGKYIQNQKINSAMSVFNSAIAKSLQFSQAIVNPWMILALAIDEAIKRFVALDKAAEKFRRDTGYTINQTNELRENVEAVNRLYVQHGINIEKSFDAAKALTDTFQGLGIASKDNVAFVALFKENLGIAVNDSAQVLQNFMGLGGTTADVAKDTIRMGAALSQNVGVSFADVMRDVKDSSKEAALMIGGNPAKIMKAAINAKILGTTLASAAKSARSLLNFDESINNELEASVLLGKNINFMNSRRLAFEGNIVESQKSALDVIKQSGDFNSMNVLQREALAKAAGMEVDEISKMLAQEKVRADVIRELEKDQSESGKKRLDSYQKSLDIAKDTTDELFKQELTSAKNIENAKQMQGVMANIENIIEEMKLMFSEILLPFVGPIISLLVPALKIVSGILRGLVTGFIAPIQEALKPIIDRFTQLSGETDIWTQFLENIPKVFGVIGSVIGGTIASIIKIVDLPSKALGIFIDTFHKMIENGPMAIVDGISAVNELILDAILSPFKSAWKYLKETFLGNSPSELGLEMLNGIQSVGSMILNAIIDPFKSAWNFITSAFSGDGISSMMSSLTDSLISPFKIVWNYVSDIFGESGQFITMVKTIGGSIVDLLLSPIKSTMSLIKGFTDAVGITKPEQVNHSRSTQSDSDTSSVNSVDNAGVEQKLDRLISIMSETNTLLKSGAISVYLDGKKVSREIALSIS